MDKHISTSNKRVRMHMRRRVGFVARNHHQPEQLKLNMEIKEDALNAAVLEVLDKDNYVAWSVQVKTYLMAQDLWKTVEATTEPPDEEDDEAAFKAWSNKNSRALNVLQVSCGQDALSEIRGISSAKIAWNTLAEKYNISKNTNSVALQVLDKANYVDWSARVKNYLMEHDLWDIIEADEADKDDEGAFNAWNMKNFMALHVIQILCGPNAFFEIIEISLAKIAWDTLAKKYNVPENTNSAVLEVLDDGDNYMEWSVRVKTYLKAHDLWDIIEATTEPPMEEDDEVAFQAWTKKNSMALNAIRISCGQDAFYDISEIQSAKIAWDTLAETYNVLENTTSDVHELLDEDNYKEWSIQVKTNLMDHDLWDIIEATTEPPRQEDDEAAFKAWTKKNFMALHAIQISCRSHIFSDICEISSAKIAWDTLAEKYIVPLHTNSGSGENGNNDYVQYEALKKAVQSGDWNAAEEFLKRQPGATIAKITPFGHTVLNIAVKADHEHIVEKLVDLMSEEDLAIKNSSGHTALVGIINIGNYRMASCMLRKNKNLLSIKDSNEQIPVIQAISNGHIELARYLYSLTTLEDLTLEKGINGATLCTEAIRTRSLDIALDLIKRCPRLTLALDVEDHSPLYALADMPYAFTGGDQLVFWKRWIYSCIHIQPASAIDEIRLNIQNIETWHQSDQVKIIGPVLTLFRQLVSNLLKFSGIKDLYEMKFLYVQSHELLDRMCNEVSIYLNNEQRDKGRVYDAIFRSIEKGNFEFIFAIVRANPDLLWSRGEDSGSIFTFAVLHRQAKIFSLMYGLAVKNSMTTSVDDEGNNILHMAGMTRASVLLNQIPGAALQMQRELQWFKEVESIVLPKVKESLNSEGLTPRELFTQNHMDLMEKGEQWMKGTASSCTVVGALIVTIMFAAAFTVPGGNNQDTGFPIFLQKKLFMLFIISDALSLFSSSTSMLIFLGILTSRYAEDDFLESLPRKMIIGLSTLFFSIATMMIAFSAALLILLHGQSWIFIPVVCLASAPITLFVLMQFPLLADMFISSYGRGIFDKKMKRWV